MNEWQRSFQKKLEVAKKQWLHKFEHFASEHLEPIFLELDEFATTNGFSVATPDCEPGTRLFKFGLTENGYVLASFRMRGLDTVEASTEVFVPGPEGVESVKCHADLCDANDAWAREQFEHALDRFIVAFGTAGAADSEYMEELAEA